MNPAEFKTLREALGLTLNWVAEQAGVGIRTCQYWESGRSEPPADVVEMLQRLDAQIDRVVVETVDAYVDVSDENGEPVDIELYRYRENIDLWSARPEMRPLPVTYHAAMVFRIAKALRNIGLTVSITYK
ncbi:helix-turn-helix domain-containing protein [Ampullimonas aquatilis]|uniref:helix-turn-helix domain-containing protein n=1 Tax=Ampullimonas aquatilis TaxID=1341549 RepID=UPI003C75808F